jgi:PAS domain S-box-containing protein
MQTGKTDVTPKLKILIIEDEELHREYLSDFLVEIGFCVELAENGRAGLDIIRNSSPDLVITDLRMPEMDGLEVLSVLQKEYPDLPVIVLSGTGTLTDVVQSLKFGAWDYILKPLHDYGILQLSVNRVLERKRLISENNRYREHLEEEVVQRTHELLKSTQRFETLFNLTGDAIFIHDPAGAILEFNLQATAFSGYPRELLRTMNIQELIDSAECDRYLTSCSALEPYTQSMFETIFRSVNGSPLHVEVNVSRIIMDAAPQILVVCRDISERRKNEEERRTFEKQLMTAQKMESLGLLASGIAHDFNNILSALRGYAILIEADRGNPLDTTEYVGKINEIVDMGQKLTQRITTFIRKAPDELAAVDVHKLLADTESLLHVNCKNVILSLDLKANAYCVLGDESQLQNAFLNLGLNALDAMPDGGSLTFTTDNLPGTKNSEPNKYLRILVTDTGTGMSPETMSRIFDPLFTTKERGKGTGLGLTSVLCCIKNLHGEIDVQSRLGVGTVFRLKLPIYPGCEKPIPRV